MLDSLDRVDLSVVEQELGAIRDNQRQAQANR